MKHFMLDFHPALSVLPALAVVVVATVISCTALGLLLGAIGLRARDTLFGANLTYFLMLQAGYRAGLAVCAAIGHKRIVAFQQRPYRRFAGRSRRLAAVP